MKRTYFFILVAFTLLLTSCFNSYSDETIYVAVKCVNSNLWSILDVESGELICEDEFKEQPSRIINDVFFVKNSNGTYDYYNVNDLKKPINEESYKAVTGFSGNGLALAVKSGGTIEIIDTKGKAVKELENDIVECTKFTNGLAVITDERGKKGYIDEKGNIVIKPQYDDANGFYVESKYAVASKKSKDDVITYYAIDKQGKELFSFTSEEYDNATGFSEECLLAIKGESVYFIGLDGKKIERKEFGQKGDIAYFFYGFRNGLSVFYDGSSYGLKEKNGDIKIRAKYDFLFYCEKDLYGARKQGKYGLVNSDDETVLDFEYEYLDFLKTDRFIAGDEKVKSLIDMNGKDVCNSNFSEISYADSYSVKSNYFNAKKTANEFSDLFDSEKCARATAKTTLRELSDLIDGTASVYSYRRTLTDDNENIKCQYLFNRNIAKKTYETYYGYSFSSGYEFDYSNSVNGVILSESVEDFDVNAEESFVKAFEALLPSKGFKKSNNGYYFRSSNGHNVGAGYSDGEVRVYYYFDDDASMPIIREKRVKLDEVDAKSGATYVSDSDTVVIDDVSDFDY